LMYYTLPRPV
uniref:Peptide TRP-J1 n=1 Tax=Phasmahyla jandaia TaxID=762504 RepID=TRPJ1_PHAJA|nr:RecName: Full=Peptide TRP-J1 [Phasmahyla jandaia]